MTKLSPGTQNSSALVYTDEQLETLESMKDDRYVLGIARAEYKNHVLHPDGTLTGDVQLVRDSMNEVVGDLEKKFSASAEALTKSAVASKSASPSQKDAVKAERDQARATSLQISSQMAAAHAKQMEVEGHIDADRFLFVVDEQGIPLVYFQCAVEGNPDTPMLKADVTPEHLAEMNARVEKAAAEDAAIRAQTPTTSTGK